MIIVSIQSTFLNTLFYLAFTSQIQETVNRIRKYVPDFDWDAWEEGVKYWGESGWTFIPEAPIALFKTKTSSQLECDKIALTYLKKEDMECLFQKMKEMKINQSELDEAICCYNNRCYRGCAMILCSIIDGIIYKRQKCNSSKRKGNKNFFTKIRDNGIKEEIIQNSFYLLYMDNLIAYMKKLFEYADDFKITTTVLNRNFLLHGMLRRNVKKEGM